MFREGNNETRRDDAQYVTQHVNAADLEEAKGREGVLIRDIRYQIQETIISVGGMFQGVHDESLITVGVSRDPHASFEAEYTVRERRLKRVTREEEVI